MLWDGKFFTVFVWYANTKPIKELIVRTYLLVHTCFDYIYKKHDDINPPDSFY